MLIRMLAGNEAARANLAPKLIRGGLVLLCLWWVFNLLLAGQTLGYPPPAILLEPRFLPTVLWIAIALLAWGLLRGSLTQTAPKALPLVLSVILCGQALQYTAVWLQAARFIVAEFEYAAWEWAAIGAVGALLLGSRVATVFLFRRWPLLVLAIVLFHALPPVLFPYDPAVEAVPADFVSVEAKDSSHVSSAGAVSMDAAEPDILAAGACPRPSFALDLFSIALLYAYYRSRRAAPSQEAPAP